MQVEKEDIGIIPDNEDIFISLLLGIIESVDELSHVQINKIHSTYFFRIAPSIPIYATPLLDEILKFNTKYGIRVDISKSIKSSGGSLNFEINTK